MKYNVTMPSLGADMEHGKLLKWYIKPGDAIKKGDLIAMVETQKSAVDIESFRSGTVLELTGEIDALIDVGAVIAVMEVEADGDAAGTVKPPATDAAQPAPTPAGIQTNKPADDAGARLRISPAARRLAEQSGLDIKTLGGSGPEGVIELHDVQAALTAPHMPAADTAPKGASIINVREAIARAMSRSKREIPHYYLQSRLHIDTLTAWLDASNRALPPDQRLFLPAVLMRATALALKACPDMNGYFENGAFTPKAEIHLGVTVALKPDGVMVPAILNAHTMTLAELNAAFLDLIQRTRAGKLRNRELTDGTVTVTNVGELGADAVTGVIFPPQVALIGFGRVRKAAIVDADGGLRAGLVLDASLAADHRVSDGLAGSKLLNALGSLLAQPDRLA